MCSRCLVTDAHWRLLQAHDRPRSAQTEAVTHIPGPAGPVQGAGLRTQVEMDESLSLNTRRSFSFSSLRIKKRQNSDNEAGFTRRRGLRSFSSARETSRQGLPTATTSLVPDGAGASKTNRVQDLVKKFHVSEGEPPKDHLVAPDAFVNHSVAPPGEDADHPGVFKRFSALLPSFRKGKRDKVKDSEPPEMLDNPPSVDNVSKQPRCVSGQYFFEYLVVVSLKKTKEGGSYEPQITYQFPKRDTMARFQKEEEEKTLKAITLFSFPEGISWAPLTEYHSETFSFVLTEIDGSRRNGYCRRLLPGGKGARPPEAYCIISTLACFGLFSAIFDEVEKRLQISKAMIYPFMQKLREAQFPAPGHTVEIKSFIPESGTEIIRLTRPLDSWLEHVNFHILFDSLKDTEVLQVFAAAVLERRIIFIAEELGKLSQVLHAVAALLYPFTWQHTFISIVPEILIDVVMAPTPYLLGVQKRLLDLVTDQSDLLVVDLSVNKKTTFIVSIGDEDSILPPKLHAEILEALSRRKKDLSVEELNRVVSEAFLHFFVRTVGHYASFVRYSEGGGVFEKRRFYKHVESKTTRHFVKKFIQTQMFDLFIQEVEKQQPPGPQGIFQRKIVEYQKKLRKH
ncbi:DENN/MADD domain containing 2Da [Austrofundulus limnaeus]|uniref:DENN/MADD domain containing 2Da n=1 Tax=Austrofundulus limnaeus TaxID=52670 RepID=A0A2I4CJL7_AUSLI|nr:PREDICTED: DENN domain-containing protein 2D [Austrofundulus limnaeus]